MRRRIRVSHLESPKPVFVAAFIMPSVAARRLLVPPGSGRRAVPRWLGLLVTFGVVIVIGMAFGGAYWDTYKVRREASRLGRERDDLRRQNVQLREEIRLLNTPEYVERIAREQLGLVKPGEVAVILVAPTPAPVAPAGPDANGSSPVGSEQHESWWTRLLRPLTHERSH
jgi:cell division protein DivIC